MLLGAALLIVACSGARHRPPETVRAFNTYDMERATPYRSFGEPVDLSPYQLQALQSRQNEVFAEYRLQYGDAFTIQVRDREDLAARVRVLNDGSIYFGFLGRSLNVHGKSIQELLDLLKYGDPPQRPCPNCGYFHAIRLERCPACAADPYDLASTAKVLLDAEAQAHFEKLGGLVHHEDQPLRRIRDSSLWLAICMRGMVGLREVDDGSRTEIVWTQEMRLPIVSRTHALNRNGSADSPWPVRLGRGWSALDLNNGRVTNLDAERAERFMPYSFRGRVEPNGLNATFREPQVQIADFEPGPESYTVNVIGAVNNPGRVPIQVGNRLWDAISAAGGPAIRQNIFDSGSVVTPRLLPTVDWERAVLLRQNRHLPESVRPPGTRPHDLVPLRVDFAAVTRGDMLHNVPLFPGDTIYLPEYIVPQTRVIVAGNVAAPNLYYFDGDVGVLGALARAGWFDENAVRGRAVTLVRNSFGGIGERGVYLIDAEAVAKGRVPNVLLESGDILYVDTKFITDAAEFLARFNAIIPGIPLDLAATRIAFETITE